MRWAWFNLHQPLKLEIRKKEKEKKKKTDQPEEKLKNPLIEDKEKCKLKYPCLICDEDHYTKYCLHRADVNHFLKGTSRKPIVLTNPFPFQQIQMVTLEQPSTLGRSYLLMCTTYKHKDVSLTTWAKDYPSSNGSVV